MTINDQDIAWASLPSYSRELARNMYKTSHDGNVKFLLENLYGKHNLTSDTEPEEILFYPRKDVQEFYAEICKTIDRSQDTNVRICSQGKIIALKSLFGDKCLPDKEEPNSLNLSNSCKIGKDKQPKPKFKVGQLVRCLEDWVQGNPLKIINYDAEDNTYLLDGLTGYWLEESQLEPYTEEKEPMKETPFKVGDEVIANIGRPVPAKIIEIVDKDFAIISYRDMTKKVLFNNIAHYEESIEESKEPMEEKESGKEDNFTTKELNLCELLAYQDLSGTYSPIYGEVRVTDIACDCLVITPEHSSDNNVELFPDGRFSKNGDCLLFPSRALYEKYPLDAYSAWMEWKAERKPKHTLQAQIRLISNDGKTIEDYECVEVEVPNIDLTQAAEAVRETLMKIHEKKLK